MPYITKEELKKITKEALKEWLDEKYSSFGKWTAGAVAAAVLVALTYFIFWMQGWKK